MIVVASFIIFLQIASAVFILPSWLISFYKEKDAGLQKKYMDNLALSQNLTAVYDKVTLTNAKLKIIQDSLSYPKFKLSLDTIIQNKSGSIYVTGINYAPTSIVSANIILEGIANTRESLVSFVKTLEETEAFKEVNLPVGNLAQDKNINFSIELSVAS